MEQAEKRKEEERGRIIGILMLPIILIALLVFGLGNEIYCMAKELWYNIKGIEYDCNNVYGEPTKKK